MFFFIQWKEKHLYLSEENQEFRTKLDEYSISDITWKAKNEDLRLQLQQANEILERYLHSGAAVSSPSASVIPSNAAANAIAPFNPEEFQVKHFI